MTTQAPQRAWAAPRVRTYARQREWAVLALITLGAVLLRVIHIERVSPDPFYDAAVRSMSMSWHNFFFGAFEPGGSVSIDKPPLDLWLQVFSVKALGFSSTTLKVPEILAGIASVPLVYAVVRRVWGAAAALAGATAMAVLPVEVITARSDTMDAVMMALILVALLMLIRAAEEGGGRGWLFGAAATMGVAFNVKLLESIIALPALAVFAFMALPGSGRQRAMRLLAATGVYVVVALSWLTATLAVPAHDRPFAIGSSNGSAWNAAFVFNGTERLGGKSPEPQFTVYQPGHHYPEATQSQRDHIPIVPPSPTRLLARIGPLSGQRLGLMLLAALMLGLPALFFRLGLDRRVRGRKAAAVDDLAEPAARGGEPRIQRAFAAGLLVWMVSGIVLFSHMARLHPRYVEAFTPAVAALLGIGAAWAVTPRGRAPLAVLATTLAVVVVYAERLLYGTPPVWWITLAAALGAVACAVLAHRAARDGRAGFSAASAAALALTLVAVLAVPLKSDFTSIRDGVTDAGYVGALPSEEQRLLSSYLRAHQNGAHYELASETATGIGSLIVQDARPVLVLTSYGTRVFTPVAKLQRLIAEGKVRYAFLNTRCGKHAVGPNAACTAPVKWVRAHGTDVSADAGLPQPRLLYLLPGAHP